PSSAPSATPFHPLSLHYALPIFVPTPIVLPLRTRTPAAQRKPNVVVAAPSTTVLPAPAAKPSTARVNPERSLAGAVKNVLPDALDRKSTRLNSSHLMNQHADIRT